MTTKPLTPIDPARMLELADFARAPTYRRGVNGEPEHRCTGCRQWLPATAQHFHAGVGSLQARCRPCASAKQSEQRAIRKAAAAAEKALRAETMKPPAAPKPPPPVKKPPPAPAERERIPHLPAVLEAERQCRTCGVSLPLTPECWPQQRNGGFAPICLDCAASLRSRAGKRVYVFTETGSEQIDASP